MSTGHLLDADALRRTMVTFRDLLHRHRESINRLNVYPVPDGDTGTNMALTLDAVVGELEAADPSMSATCRAIGHGSLMGARGNSGVILSQILRGMSARMAEFDAVDGALLAEAMVAASEAAYGAVGRPVEGTILTVVREASEAAAQTSGSLVEVLDAARRRGAESLERTPELLSVLAEAGVVDAGATGWLLMLDAALHVVDDRELPKAPEPGPEPSAAPSEPVASDLRFEVMYLLEAPDEAIEAFKDVWAGIGDSIVVVGGDGLFNCHIHTDDIGASIEAALDIGRPRDIRVTDLAHQVEELAWVAEAQGQNAPADHDRVDTAVVAVSPAEGTSRIFHSLRVQRLVSGGQTMNPSTEQLLAAVEGVNADEVVILPNNANIVAVARQLDELTDKAVRVVPTRSVVEGFAALMDYDPFQDAETNAALMGEAAAAVVTGEVVQAVRASSSPAGPIEAGDWLGLDAQGVRVIAASVEDAATRLLDLLLTDEQELVTVIEGEGAGAATTRRLVAWLEQSRPGVGVEVHQGGQPHYPYWFGIE